MSTPAAAASNGPPPAEKTPDSPAKDDDDKLPTDDDSDDIHGKLRALRLDEVPGLSQNPTNIHTINAAHNWMKTVWYETGRYLRFVYQTFASAIASTIFGGLGLFDLFSLWFFALLGVVVLFGFLIFCLALRLPFLVRAYYWWSDKYGGSLGMINSGNPNLFKAMTKEQAQAAKEGLSKSFKDSPNTIEHRVFDLDVAKMLLQIASVVYEHQCDSIREAVGLTASTGKPAPNVIVQAAAGLDSALSSTPLFGGEAAEVHAPGTLLADLWSPQTSHKAEAALDSEGDQHIRDFVAEYGMDFEPVSELNNTSSAFAGLFWDPNGNWIVVGFKGTAPLEFGECLSDMNAKMIECSDAIAGYSKCHLGFKERVFPQNIADLGGFRPYDTIALGIKTLAKWLRKKNNIPEDTKINVWFTGHSLGCAVASLTYSRLLMHEKDIGKHAVLRDAYLYGAPILTDRPCVDVFNNKMTEKKKKLKTMWRVTNNNDFVATGLPSLGDRRDITVSPNNAFAFAHLGAELIMKPHPHKSNVSGNHILYSSPVSIYSKFKPDEIAAQRAAHLADKSEVARMQRGAMLQKIPGIGRMLAHFTVFYWDSLDDIGTGSCDWVVR